MTVFSLSRLSSYPQLPLWVKLWYLAKCERPDPECQFQTNTNCSNSLVKILLPKKTSSPDATFLDYQHTGQQASETLRLK